MGTEFASDMGGDLGSNLDPKLDQQPPLGEGPDKNPSEKLEDIPLEGLDKFPEEDFKIPNPEEKGPTTESKICFVNSNQKGKQEDLHFEDPAFDSNLNVPTDEHKQSTDPHWDKEAPADMMAMPQTTLDKILPKDSDEPFGDSFCLCFDSK